MVEKKFGKLAFCARCDYVGIAMKKDDSVMKFETKPAAHARARSVRAPAKGDKKDALTPSQRRIADESLKRFDALYRKLAE